MRRAFALLAGGLLLLLLAACDPAHPPSADDIVAHWQAELMRNVHMVSEMTVSAGSMESAGRPLHLAVEQWSQGPYHYRYVYLPESTYGAGRITVRNDGHLWYYFPSSNSYLDLMLAAPPAISTQAMTQQVRRELDAIMANFTVTFQGIEPIADRPSYKLSAVQKATTTLTSGSQRVTVAMPTITLWIDTQTWRVLRVDYGAPMSVSVTTREIDYPAQMDPGLFTFTAPPGARRIVPRTAAAR